ncbi:MAG: adenylate kinase [Calditrichaeota bacterium]|nr:MAG: adenylate kinase [Calditrichota bacterium]
MNIALIGASGVGKGTYAHQLAKQFALRHVSTGDLLRTSILNKSALGILVSQYIEAGDFVPDEFIDAIIEESLESMDSDIGILFDGFPRTVYQAQFLSKILLQFNKKLDAIIYLKANDEEIRRRLYGRLLCRKCQFPHHIDFVEKMRCQNPGCGGELFRRPDDKGNIPVARLRVYHRESAPLLEFYSQNSAFHVIDAERPILDVRHDLEMLFEEISTKVLPQIKREKIPYRQAERIEPAVAKTAAYGPDIILLGAPGSGKGTQAKYIYDEFGLVQISTGDIFRKHIAQKTELGKLAQFYIERGELVPQDITESMVRKRLDKEDTVNGIVLDGFPRTLTQANALAQLVKELGRNIAGAIYISVPDEDIISRISGRISCKKCNRPFHKRFNPFKKCPGGVCDGEYLFQRQDDTPETVSKRLYTFHEQTQPLIDYYRNKDLLNVIDGTASVEDVTKKIFTLVRNFQNSLAYHNN